MMALGAAIGTLGPDEPATIAIAIALLARVADELEQRILGIITASSLVGRLAR